MQSNGRFKARSQRPFRLAWLPIPLVVLAIVGLWVADPHAAWRFPPLLWLLAYGPTALAMGFIVVPAARLFLANGQPGVLMLGCGMWVVSLGVVCGVSVGSRSLDLNWAVYDSALLLSALCHFAGVALSPRHGIRPGHRAPWLVVAYAGALAAVGLFVLGATMGKMPAFFIAGQGGTRMRAVILIAAVTLFILTAGLLWQTHRRAPSPFLYWYALGLALLGTGLAGSMSIASADSPLQWTTRTTRALGTLYLCVAVLVQERTSGTRQIPWAAVAQTWRERVSLVGIRWRKSLGWGLRYGAAAAAVAVSYMIRLAIWGLPGPGAPPYQTFYPTVAIVTLFAGLGPGLLATALAALVVDYWILQPVGHFNIASATDRLGLVVFTSAGLLISVVAELYRRARYKAAAYDRQTMLRESEERFRMLANHIPQLCWMAHPDGWIYWYNMRWYEYTGTVPAQMEGWGWQSVHSPEVLPRVMEQWKDSITTGRPFEMVFPLRGADGQFRPFLTRVVPVHDGNGGLVHWFGTSTDITETMRVEEERRLLEAQVFQAQRLESLGKLAGGVAHDLNNVLAAILGLASIHQEEAAPSSTLAKSLATIVTACERGRDVVKGLLAFARKGVSLMGPVDLNILVKQIVHLLEATTLKRVRVTTDLQEPIVLVQGDEAALSNALMNLCMNSVDAMADGGSLTIRTRLTDAGAELRVVDSGVGMTPEVLKQAVDPFFTTKPLDKGTGLGLAMVYGTMEAHGGKLGIHSEVGKGTEVLLTFPPFQPPPAAEPLPEPRLDHPLASNPLSILLVDDDELLRNTVPRMLGALGHQVHTSEGGQEALNCLAEGLAVDLVVLDMKMPGLDGAHTLPRLLALRPGLKVLLASGHSDHDPLDLMVGRPNVMFIQKPFTLQELHEKIRSLAEDT